MKLKKVSYFFVVFCQFTIFFFSVFNFFLSLSKSDAKTKTSQKHTLSTSTTGVHARENRRKLGKIHTLIKIYHKTGTDCFTVTKCLGLCIGIYEVFFRIQFYFMKILQKITEILRNDTKKALQTNIKIVNIYKNKFSPDDITRHTTRVYLKSSSPCSVTRTARMVAG